MPTTMNTPNTHQSAPSAVPMETYRCTRCGHEQAFDLEALAHALNTGRSITLACGGSCGYATSYDPAVPAVPAVPPALSRRAALHAAFSGDDGDPDDHPFRGAHDE
jgi:hypothetical protein